MKFIAVHCLLLTGYLSACSSPKEQTEESILAQIVVDRAIEAHGGERYRNAVIEFDFRGRHYVSRRDGGIFQYERIFRDTIGGSPVTIKDVLNNDSFNRYIEDSEIEVSEKKKKAYSRSVNSVLYFIQQPYFLNDSAVQKEYLGDGTIAGEPYHKIQITFQKEGGGSDYQDVFIYWFHKKNYQMDYFGYSYETDGGGLRFRSAYNVQNIQGIRFADFINYKADYSKYSVQNLDELYNQGSLEELSRIENHNIRVKLQNLN